MIKEGHPYWHVRSVAASSRIATLSMSYYRYRPQTVSDERMVWSLSVEEFLSAEHVEELIRNTPEGYELALHSNVVTSSGEERHIAMIDMSTQAKAHLEKLRDFLGGHFFQQMAWFASGRSFHGYGSDLLQADEWIKFMGLLLLANKPRMEPTVDPRWIGHRLLGGFAALRWTKNTSYYLTPPTRIDTQRSVTSAGFSIAALGRPLRSR